MTTRIPTAVGNAIVDLVVDRVDAGAGPGVLNIYSGAQPASGDDPATGTLLATVTLGDPAFGDSVALRADATDPAAVTGIAAGDAGWFRITDSDGTTCYDGSVTVTGGGGELELSTITFSVGVTVDITALAVEL